MTAREHLEKPDRGSTPPRRQQRQRGRRKARDLRGYSPRNRNWPQVPATLPPNFKPTRYVLDDGVGDEPEDMIGWHRPGRSIGYPQAMQNLEFLTPIDDRIVCMLVRMCRERSTRLLTFESNYDLAKQVLGRKPNAEDIQRVRRCCRKLKHLMIYIEDFQIGTDGRDPIYEPRTFRILRAWGRNQDTGRITLRLEQDFVKACVGDFHYEINPAVLAKLKSPYAVNLMHHLFGWSLKLNKGGEVCIDLGMDYLDLGMLKGTPMRRRKEMLRRAFEAVKSALAEVKQDEITRPVTMEFRANQAFFRCPQSVESKDSKRNRQSVQPSWLGEPKDPQGQWGRDMILLTDQRRRELNDRGFGKDWEGDVLYMYAPSGSKKWRMHDETDEHLDRDGNLTHKYYVYHHDPKGGEVLTPPSKRASFESDDDDEEIAAEVAGMFD